MVKVDKRQWKSNYFEKLSNCFDEYSKCFLVIADNVGSSQMQKIRSALRGNAVLVMGKNTMIRKIIRNKMDENPNLEKLLPHVVENIGFVFTHGDMCEIRDILLENKVKAPARVGAVAQVDVVVPAQNTGLGPEKTSFFQALSIASKITKGTIEITNAVPLIQAGSKVGSSEATLLQMLHIMPFSYGLVIKKIYDSGSIMDPSILDLTSDDIVKRFSAAVSRVAALSLDLGIPTCCSAPHMLSNAFRRLLAVSVNTDYTFEQSKTIKEYLADPSKFSCVATAPVADAATPQAEQSAAVQEVEEEEESDEDMGFGLFD